MSSKMKALEQCLDAKPADPVGFPTGRTIATAGQIASHLGNGRALGFCGHASGHHGEATSIHRREIRA